MADIVATGVVDIAATGVVGTQQKGFEVGPAHMAGWVVPRLVGKLDLERVVAPSVAQLGRGVLASVPVVRVPMVWRCDRWCLWYWHRYRWC